jgi:hypothetical protein
MTLRELDLASLPVSGALGSERSSDGGIVFRRLPDWTRPQLADPQLQLVVQIPSGVRLELVTDTTVVELDVAATCVELQATDTLLPASIDLVVDGELRQTGRPSSFSRIVLKRDRSFEFVEGPPATVRFEGLPGRAGTQVEVWLPHAAVTELRGVRVDADCSIAAVSTGRRRWVHVGSSISHCLEAPSPTATWPAIVARRADLDLVNLGLAGQCMLDQFTARAVRDLQVDLISVKAGINVVNADAMRERTYVSALHGFLDMVRDGHPTTPLVLATPILCPVAEDHPGPTLVGDDGRVYVVPRAAELDVGALTLRRIRELMGSVVEARSDPNLHLLDGLSLLGPGEEDLLPDGLHPNAAGYALMADRFYDLAVRKGPFS